MWFSVTETNNKCSNDDMFMYNLWFQDWSTVVWMYIIYMCKGSHTVWDEILLQTDSIKYIQGTDSDHLLNTHHSGTYNVLTEPSTLKMTGRRKPLSCTVCHFLYIFYFKVLVVAVVLSFFFFSFSFLKQTTFFSSLSGGGGGGGGTEISELPFDSLSMSLFLLPNLLLFLYCPFSANCPFSWLLSPKILPTFFIYR